MNKKPQKTVDFLLEEQLIAEQNAVDIAKVTENFSFAITKTMLQQIDKNNPHDPIAKQFIPSVDELSISAIERNDPIADNIHTKVPGIIHRYPDRCLLTPVHVCPVYCRFCFRKEKVGAGSATMSQDELQAAFSYIKSHSEIWEVIITGGDPFILKPSLIKNIMTELNAIPHVEIIRFHTRIPVVQPEKITAELIAALKCDKTVYVVLHSNHPNEFTADAKIACASLIDAGIPMLSQTVLLKSVNDDIATLSALMKNFIKNRIKPYYLHHGDLAKGTEHFRVSIDAGQMLMKELRGRFSGLCQPTYVLDIPGGYGKMPIGPHYLHRENETSYTIQDYCGNHHVYPPLT